MPKHNDYPHKMTLSRMEVGKDKTVRFRVWFPKKDAEKIMSAAEEGKELVFKITSDPTTLKEKSIVLLLEPLITDQETRDMKLTETDEIFNSGDPKKILALLRPHINTDNLTKEELQKLLDEVYEKLFTTGEKK